MFDISSHVSMCCDHVAASISDNNEEDTFQAAVHIGELDLSSRSLPALPDWLNVCAGLLVLNVSSNSLKTLPSSLSGLQALKVLDASFNQLEVLPVGLAALTALTCLELSYNRLSTLGDETGQLTALQVLNLSDNQLTHIPPGLASLHKLQDLQLQYNQICSLPGELADLSQLTSLDLSGNPLPAKLLAVTHAGPACGSALKLLLGLIAQVGLVQKQAGTPPLHVSLSSCHPSLGRPPRPADGMTAAAGADVLLLDDDGSVLAESHTLAGCSGHATAVQWISSSTQHTSGGVGSLPQRQLVCVERAHGTANAGICISGPGSQAAACSAESEAAAAVTTSLKALRLSAADLSELPPAAAAVMYRTLDAASTGVQEMLLGRPYSRGGSAFVSPAFIQQQLADCYKPPLTASRRPPTALSARASRPSTATGLQLPGSRASSRPESASLSLGDMLAMTSSNCRQTSSPPVQGTMGINNSSSASKVVEGFDADLCCGLQNMPAITFPLASGVRSMFRRSSPTPCQQPSRPSSSSSTSNGICSEGGDPDARNTLCAAGGKGAWPASNNTSTTLPPSTMWNRGSGTEDMQTGAFGSQHATDGFHVDVVKQLLLTCKPELLQSLNDALCVRHSDNVTQ